MPAETIYVKGLPELVRAFERTEGALPHDLTAAMEEAGQVVKAQVASNAQEVFQSASDLVGSIDNVSRGPRAYVRVTALRRDGKNAPYSYPRAWEYANPVPIAYGRSSRAGRPFARRALAEKADAVYAIVDGMLAKLGGEWEA